MLIAIPGSIVRIGPNEVVCIDMGELHRISGPKSQYRKDKWHLIGRMIPGQDSVFSMLEPERRRERRKMVAPAVSFSFLLSVTPQSYFLTLSLAFHLRQSYSRQGELK